MQALQIQIQRNGSKQKANNLTFRQIDCVYGLHGHFSTYINSFFTPNVQLRARHSPLERRPEPWVYTYMCILPKHMRLHFLDTNPI